MLTIKDTPKAPVRTDSAQTGDDTPTPAAQETPSTPMSESGEPKSEAEDAEANNKTEDVPDLNGLSREERSLVLESCVNLMGVPVDHDALNAVLRLCLRLTQDFDAAIQFTELGGIKMLLALDQGKGHLRLGHQMKSTGPAPCLRIAGCGPVRSISVVGSRAQ